MGFISVDHLGYETFLFFYLGGSNRSTIFLIRKKEPFVLNVNIEKIFQIEKKKNVCRESKMSKQYASLLRRLYGKHFLIKQ